MREQSDKPRPLTPSAPAKDAPPRVLNLGIGTQSSVVMFLMERGELPRADYAVFSDTGWEPAEVYEHLEWLKERTTIPIVTVTAGNIYNDAMQPKIKWSKESGKGGGVTFRSMPLYVLNTHRKITGPGLTLWGLDDTEYMRLLDVPDEGRIKRQCTKAYKVEPIQKWIKANIFGSAPGERWPTTPSVVQVFGISHDELGRMKVADPWSSFEYPFVDMRWHRLKVISWAEREFPDHTFPRSACIGCPFHSNAEWLHIRNTDPKGWNQAVALDEKIRDAGGTRGKVFLHRSCVPLKDADIAAPDTNQTRLNASFENECVGMCGV